MTVKHVFSNPVPDETATSRVRPSDWNSAHAQVMEFGGNTAGASSWSGTNLQLDGGPGVTLSVNGNTLSFIAAAAVALAISAGSQSASAGTLVFANSNGVVFGMSDSTVTASHNGLTTARASNDAIGLNTALTANGVSVTANSSGLSLNFPAFLTTAAPSNHSHGNPTLALTNLTGTTNSDSAGFTLSLSAAAPVPQTNQTLGLYASSQTYGQSSSTTVDARSLSVVGSGAVAVGYSAGSMLISAAAQSVQTQNMVTVQGSTGAITFQTGNGITFGGAGGTITASHNGITSQSNQVLSIFAASNTTQSSSGTMNASSMVFAGAGIASVGVSGGSVVVSVPPGGGAGGVFAGVSNLGNTAGSTGTVSTGNVVLVGSNGITLSQSTGAAGSAATITIIGNQLTRDNWEPGAQYGQLTTFPTGLGQGSVFIFPSLAEEHITASAVMCLATMSISTSSNSSYAHAISLHVGVYTRTGNTLSLLSSGSQSFQFTNTSNNSNASLTGMRGLTVPLNLNLTPGQYYFALMSRTSSTNANWATAMNMRFSAGTNVLQGFIGENVTTRHRVPGLGMWSSSSSSMPASIALTQIIGQGAAGANSMLAPHMLLYNSTF